MIHRIEHFSIRQKIITGTMLIIFLITLFGFGVLLCIDIVEFRRQMENNILINAQLVGEYCVAPIDFQDKHGAQELMKKMNSIPMIKQGFLYELNGSLFAAYNFQTDGPAPLPPPPNTQEFKADGLHVCHKISYKGKDYGYIYLIASNSGLHQRIKNYITGMALLILALCLAAYLLACRLADFISSPIMNLAKVTGKIGKSGDCSLRAQSTGSDEIAVLYKGFNTMLDRIQQREEERDKALSELARREQRLSMLLATVNEGFIELDSHAVIVDVNKEMCSIVKKSRNELIGKNPAELMDDASIEIFSQQLQLRRQGQKSSYEISMKISDQYIVHCLVNGTPIIDETGRYRGSFAMITDISQRKLAEQEMNRMRMYLKNILDSMPSLIIGIDPEGRITQWNREAEQKTGISENHAKGADAVSMLPYLSQQMEMVRRAMREKIAMKKERVPSRSGVDIRYSDIMVYPLITNGTEGAVIRLDDVTDRVRIENMMVQTEKMMSVGGLAAGMAHEINNPLAGILQSAQNIMRRLSPELPKNIQIAEQCGIELPIVIQYLEARDIVKFLHSIRSSGEKAAKIVTNMLNFSRKSSMAEKTMVNLEELLERSMELAAHDYNLKKNYDFKNITIKREYTENLPPVPCEATEIEQVLINLLANAAHAMSEKTYTDNHKPCICLRLLTEDNMALIEVEDNGPGMPESIKKRIFEPFFTTKSVGLGTGLGLSVSYFIITGNHNGRLSVNTNLEQGTCFRIHLPFGNNTKSKIV